MLHARDEKSLTATLCLTFKLSRSEGAMLVQLLTNDYSTREELRTAASLDGQTIAPSSTQVLLNALRAKLKAHNVLITSVSKLGYGFDAKSRANIRRGIARYDDTGFIRPKPKTPDDLKAASPSD